MSMSFKASLSSAFLAFLLIVLMTPNSFAADSGLKSVNDVDFIDVVAYTKNDRLLQVSFLYKNRREDKLVFWRGTSTEAECDIYELVGNKFDKNKGKVIGSIRNHSLSSFSQDFYIDLVPSNERWGLAVCRWTYGGTYFHGETDFVLH